MSLLASIDFSEVLTQGMLSLLLFAGAMHVDLRELRAFRWQVDMLAIAGTLISLIHCLIFGAPISPTGPIAAIGILKSAGAPKSLELVISGESLFNDAIDACLPQGRRGCLTT